MTPDDATILKLTWKHADTLAFAIAVVQAAKHGVEFNNDDVPDTVQPNDKTTVGIVFQLLGRLGIIECTDRVRRSSRRCCNGHRNPLWRIASVSRADAFLRLNGVQPKLGQLELIAA